MSRPTTPCCRETFITIASPPRIPAKRSATTRKHPARPALRAGLCKAVERGGESGTVFGSLTKEGQEAIVKARAAAKSALDWIRISPRRIRRRRDPEDMDFRFAEQKRNTGAPLNSRRRRGRHGESRPADGDLGRLDESVALGQRAITLDPLRTIALQPVPPSLRLAATTRPRRRCAKPSRCNRSPRRTICGWR